MESRQDGGKHLELLRLKVADSLRPLPPFFKGIQSKLPRIKGGSYNRWVRRASQSKRQKEGER